MGRFLICLAFLLIMGACSRSPEFVVHDQVLEWPVLDEVTDIRCQLTYHSGIYFLAGEKSLYRISDSNADAKATLLYQFDDSLWTHYSQLWYPARSVMKPEDVNHDWFRGMSDFIIENIEAIDSNSLLVFLKFNILVRNVDRPGSSFYGRTLTFTFHPGDRELTKIAYEGYFEKKEKEVLIYSYLDNFSPIKFVREKETIAIYSSACFHNISDSNYNLPSSELIRYRLDQDEPDYYLLDTMEENQIDYENLMVKDSSLIGIDGYGPHHFIKLDTSVIRGMHPSNAVYFPNSKFPVLLKILYKPDGTRDVEISRIIDKKTQQVIWFASDITVVSHDLYPSNAGELLFFYEAEGQVHQLTISRK